MIEITRVWKWRLERADVDALDYVVNYMSQFATYRMTGQERDRMERAKAVVRNLKEGVRDE